VVILKKQGFTLIELLAVIVILAIVLAIALPSITGLIGSTTERAFLLDAKMVIKAIDYQLLEGYDLESNPIDKESFEEVLNLSAKNYESVSVALDEKDEPYVKLVGKNKWEGLTTCGTYKDMLIGKTDEIECNVPEGSSSNGNFVNCGDKLIDSRDYPEGIKNTYETVKIGNQCWFAENLRYTGKEGSSCLINSVDNWKDKSPYNACMKNIGATCTHGGDYYCDWNYETEVLYQWGAIFGSGEPRTIEDNQDKIQGLCPNGWHLPTDEEWGTLIDGLNGSAGDKLKSASDWNGNNDSGFNARPAGYRYTSGTLYSVGYYANWWSSSPGDGSNAWRRYVYSGYSMSVAFRVLRLTVFGPLRPGLNSASP
jgi:uncharacterized protein (TIGR02145 family)/prepilin-type N-terminal cleavage/methylation domain-containing protein